VSIQQKVQVSAQYLEAIRMEAGGDQDDDIDLCCQSPKRALRTDCGKEVLDPQSGCHLWPLRSPYIQLNAFISATACVFEFLLPRAAILILQSHVLDIAVSSQVSWRC
jgi:hypothetical protein